MTDAPKWIRIDRASRVVDVDYIWDARPFGVFHATRTRLIEATTGKLGNHFCYSVQVNLYAEGKRLIGCQWNWATVGLASTLPAAKRHAVEFFRPYRNMITIKE
jgi:hypothetical protein